MARLLTTIEIVETELSELASFPVRVTHQREDSARVCVCHPAGDMFLDGTEDFIRDELRNISKETR